jgi:hypothetical protein
VGDSPGPAAIGEGKAGDIVWLYHEPRLARPESAAPPPGPVEKASVAYPRQKHKGGRPAKYDWEAFYIEVIRIADLDGVPPRHDLAKQMQQWTEDIWGEQPSPTVIREKLAKIYARVGER